jgi:NTP pyrophosphatase (non-canonical NTP hydrolase)
MCSQLKRIRSIIKEEGISLKGRSKNSKSLDLLIEEKVNELEAWLVALNNQENCETEAQLTSFTQAYRAGIQRVFRAVDRSKSEIELDTNDLCNEILVDFQELVGWITHLDASELSKCKIENAALLSTQYNKQDISELLTDENILAALHEKGLKFTLEEIAEIFTSSVKLHFMVFNTPNPLKAIQKVGEHLKDTLTDEKILAALHEKGLEFTHKEVTEIFPRSARLHFAIKNVSNPLKAIQKVGEHLKDTLTDEKILAALHEKGLKFTLEEVAETFTKKIRLRLAVANISNPLKAIQKVGEHLKDTLSDKKILAALEEIGLVFTLEEVTEIFTERVRLRFAVGNISDPLKAIQKVGVHMKNTLTNENILAALKQKGLEFTLKEVAEIFTRSMRLHFAVGNITDPLEGCTMYAEGKTTYAGKYYRKIKL